ncbi:hypothetical protein [Occallatibacter riparius]|uniref:Beta-glucuronidase n=1 Tax=Occallatibacter riparius TaxID=1002689 RepID=A0A9J7BSW1_9BACT|nr:hypothetical protein [Occallatibacter riparius]UWZ85987.1 hypothetical protein MOP44_08585 [Occallatibacter riparius]
MRKIATVDPRFLSYNVEMVEVTGGRFWKPYKSAAESSSSPTATGQANQPPGMSADLYQYRPPIDLANPRLRKLAMGLSPAYVRVSGTWQNSTYFQNDDNPPLKEAPKGFKGVLTRAEWKGVVDFAQAVDDKIVTSFPMSAGTRDADGVWTPAQAKTFLDYTKAIGGSIAATEFMNEPTFPGPGGAPANYDAAAYARDAKVFAGFLRSQSPKTVFLGPGGVGEGVSMMPGSAIKMKLLASEDLLKASGPIYDAFSYHFYGGVSKRCTGNVTVAQALTPEWLDRTEQAYAFYAGLRDKYTPGKPMWLTETAEAACGGDQFAGEFADTFRFLNQLGTLAQKGVQVVMHNTLAASDYGLLDESTLAPRPDYWAAFLWKRLMGDVVLDPAIKDNENLRVYAHCTPHKSGVTLLILNTDREHEQNLTLDQAGERLTLTAPDLTSTKTMLNGTELAVQPDGSLPNLHGEKLPAGPIALPPASATFVTINGARNESCR